MILIIIIIITYIHAYILFASTEKEKTSVHTSTSIFYIHTYIHTTPRSQSIPFPRILPNGPIAAAREAKTSDSLLVPPAPLAAPPRHHYLEQSMDRLPLFSVEPAS